MDVVHEFRTKNYLVPPKPGNSILLLTVEGTADHPATQVIRPGDPGLRT